MENIVVSQITSSSPEYQQVWDLREEILRKPLGLSLKNEDLSRDHTDTIFIAEYDGRVMGCLKLQHIDDTQVQLRAMAVYDEWQGKGVGRQLVMAAEQYAAQKGYSKVILHARKVAVGFYQCLGYSLYGEEFIEVGIPHFMMEKSMVKNAG